MQKILAYLVPEYREPFNGACLVYPRVTLEKEVADHLAKTGQSVVVELISCECINPK